MVHVIGQCCAQVRITDSSVTTQPAQIKGLNDPVPTILLEDTTDFDGLLDLQALCGLVS
jgi:hypothetical protein